MKNKCVKLLLLLMLFVLPGIIHAAVLSSYGETVTKANNYILSYRDRKKYLVFNKNYVYERDGFGNSSSFTMGGLLSKGEYDLSIFSNQSYLITGKEYWTLTSDGLNKYYVDAFLQSKSTSSMSGSRVTEYVKPGTIYSGKGTYSNPWSFEDGYAVDVISNNTSFGTVSPLGEKYVRPGESLDYVLTPANGYFYNNRKDECDFVKVGANIYEDNYKIENIRKDITCTAVFELQTYVFNLDIKNEDKDYKNVKKLYGTQPSPNPIYYKYKTNWYRDAEAHNAINSITPPVITGWTFNGYYYGTTKVIESNGTFVNGAKNLDLGSRNNFIDINHTLYANITKNNYTITFSLGGGKLGGNANPDNITATYDEVVQIANPTRAGYTFDGWTFNGNSSTAKVGNASNNVNTTFTANSTKTKNTFFVNLNPTKNSTVTLTANWKICPVGTYNDGTNTCTACEPGTYTTSEGSTSCIVCEDGYYCGGGTDHNACPAGTEGTGPGKTTLANGCQNCGPGKFSANSGSASCSTCPAGKFSSGVSNTSCTSCVAGSYSASAGSTSCTACGAGKTSTAGASAATSCTNCSGINGLATWAASTWNNDNTMTNLCTVATCSAGYRKNGNSCTGCGAGTFSASAGSTSCTPCAVGSYSAGSANAGCIACGGGKTTTSTGTNASGSCKNCTAITGLNSWMSSSWTNNEVSNLCKVDKCNAGYKKDGNTCTACGPGTYSDAAGRTACTNCPAGTYSNAAVNTQCNQCPPGTYSEAGATECEEGNPGQYIPDGSPPKDCPEGYTSDAGATAITQCYKEVSCTKSDCNHDTCTITGTFSTYANCSKTNCDHNECTVSGTWNSCKYGCASYSPYCDCPDPNFWVLEDKCWNNNGVGDGYCACRGDSIPAGGYPIVEGNCFVRGNNCSDCYTGSSNTRCRKDSANHDGCSCTGKYTTSQGNKCTASNYTNHDSCSCTGTYKEYYSN